MSSNSGIGALTGNISHGGVGVVHGDVVNHYATDPEAGPAQLFTEGLRALSAGMRGQAEALIGQAIQRGHESAEVSYYWALSLTSRRSPEDLTDEDWHKLRTALERAIGTRSSGQDTAGCVAAARLTDDLLRAAVSPESLTQAGRRLDVHERLRGLPAERRGELRDHLRYVMQRVQGYRTSEEDEEEIRTRRKADYRAERVPLFFTPDPLPLRPPDQPSRSMWPEDRNTLQALLWSAGALFALGLVILIVLLTSAEDDQMAAVAVLGLIAAIPGVVLLLRHGPAEIRRRARQARRPAWARERRPAPPYTVGPQMGGPAAAVRAAVGAPGPATHTAQFGAFRARLAVMAEARFAEVRPPALPNPAAWQQLTHQVQHDLADELAFRYWTVGKPEGLDWLLQMRARQTVREWGAGRLAASAVTTPYQRWQGARKGMLFTSAAVLLVLLPALAGSSGLGLLVGAVWAAALAGGVNLFQRTVELSLVQDEQRQYAEDQRAHGQWSAYLAAHRPADTELARWLDLDKRHLLRDVLGEHRMEHRDILFNFFLMEGAPGCVTAKVRKGPPRYSVYALRLFVLTTSGVWVCTWEMDFATGTHQGRKDFVFRFDSISSVVMETRGTGLGDTHRQVIGVTAEGALTGADGSQAHKLREVLRLVLNNQQDLEVLIDNQERLGDMDGDDPQELREVALETSGVSAGFRILAALATEGEKWLDERRHQSYRAFLGESPAAGPPDTERRPRPDVAYT
ncbi:hypothetical protein [Streptomyces boncukensis]|uniref:Uncharacterized protein n=1 Tax=Streptomyces boncukensis TaxID=2711219 RepID=A0A6G4WVL3_9ACTN|nr:hypothetical protein [Streptomyces boncukensis]NGO69043.1 hypothetical protein [Streptomyces boncukensis]